MVKKKIIVIGLIILLVGSLSGCYDESNLVTNDMRGTIVKVELMKGDEVKITFGNNSHALLTADRYSDEGQMDWYEILNDAIGRNVRLVWVANYRQITIASMEYI